MDSGIFEKKRENSTRRLTELTAKIERTSQVANFSNLAIYATGSYAREEASEYSDIDLFFVNTGATPRDTSNHLNEISFFASIIDIAREMGFPKFSNDGAFLKIIHTSQMLEFMGSADDDKQNHFTARLLLLLESKCVYGRGNYNSIVSQILDSYFRDYPDHPEKFLPTFLVNDILRFWKTLCLNYENKRNQPTDDETKRLKQKVKNLKLKFSRMLTCFGSICYIASLEQTFDITQMQKMVDLSPINRLRIASKGASVDIHLAAAEKQYAWFLQLTDIPEDQLIARFATAGFKTEAFGRADEFGSDIFEITRAIAEKNSYLRYLVV